MVPLLAGSTCGRHTEIDVSVILPPRQIDGAEPCRSVGLALWFHVASSAVGLHPIATLQTEAQHSDCADSRPLADENCCL